MAMTSNVSSAVRSFSTSTRLCRISRRELMDKEKLKKELKQFLGPRNIKGEYHRNKYFYVPQNHTPNYIETDGMPVVNGDQVASIVPRRPRFKTPTYIPRDPSVHPFPHNTHTRTAHIIPQDLKDRIVDDATVKGYHPQEIAHKYGINLQRIEAIIKLHSIEQNYEAPSELKHHVKRFADIMKRMFPVFEGGYTADNLTEIPTPHKTLTDRFITIEKNEPFGPVDAAKILKLEPAAETLKSLTEFNLEEAQKKQQLVEDKKINVVYGKKREADRALFKFTVKNVGEFGHRYGASRRDKKIDRRVGFDAAGRMVYMHPPQ